MRGEHVNDSKGRMYKAGNLTIIVNGLVWFLTVEYGSIFFSLWEKKIYLYWSRRLSFWSNVNWFRKYLVYIHSNDIVHISFAFFLVEFAWHRRFKDDH